MSSRSRSRESTQQRVELTLNAPSQQNSMFESSSSILLSRSLLSAHQAALPSFPSTPFAFFAPSLLIEMISSSSSFALRNVKVSSSPSRRPWRSRGRQKTRGSDP